MVYPPFPPAFPSPVARRQHRGFSLVEMLVVVALVGILSGVALAWFATARHDVVKQVVNQRNAQEIVSLAVCATVGGAEFVVPGDKMATVNNLVTGAEGRIGAWKGQIFRLSSLDPDVLVEAMPFVKMEGDVLLYVPSGGQM